MKLQDPNLLRERCYVGGAWVQADAGGWLTVTDPASGIAIAQVPDLGAAETRRAIAAADAAWPAWRALTAEARCALMRRWHDLILAHTEDLARIMTAEQGKPLAEARGEVAYSASFMDWFAEEGRRVYGDLIPAQQPSRRILVLK
jgi:succinate-semialdehyde dehydrogenase / glutarate-semialdehyde dehydrogenase